MKITNNFNLAGMKREISVLRAENRGFVDQVKNLEEKKGKKERKIKKLVQELKFAKQHIMRIKVPFFIFLKIILVHCARQDQNTCGHLLNY